MSPSTPYLFQRLPHASIDVLVKIWRQVLAVLIPSPQASIGVQRLSDDSIDVLVKTWHQALATLIPSARKSILAGTRIEWIVQSDIARPEWPLESSSSGEPAVTVNLSLE